MREEMTTGVMKFRGDRIATFTSSFGATDRSVFEVIGTKGVVKMDPAYEMVEALETGITVGEKANKKTYGKRDQFAPELVYFSDCVLQNRRPEPSSRLEKEHPNHRGDVEISGDKSSGFDSALADQKESDTGARDISAAGAEGSGIVAREAPAQIEDSGIWVCCTRKCDIEGQ